MWAPAKQEACFIHLLFSGPASYIAKAQQKLWTNQHTVADFSWALQYSYYCPWRKLPHPQVLLQLAWPNSPKPCQALSRYAFIWGHPDQKDGDGVLPKYHEGYGMLPFCVLWLPYTFLCSNKNKRRYQFKVMCPGTKAFWRKRVYLQCMIYPWVKNMTPLSSLRSSALCRHNPLTHQRALGSPALT